MSKIIRITKLQKEEANNIIASKRNSNEHGFMFIIPNQARKVSDYDNKRAEALLNLYGCSFGTEMVQIWTTNEAEDNWCDHGDPYGREFETGLKSHLFPGEFPREFFQDNQEGDLIVLDMEDENGEHHYQECVLRQLGYRYERFGRFEEVLEKI